MKFKWVVSLLLVLSLLMSACGNKGEETTTVKQQETGKQQVTNIKIATGTVGGTFYVIGSGFAKIISEKVPGLNATAEENSIIGSIRSVGKGSVELGMTQPETLFWALSGDRYFEGEKYPELAVIMPGPSTPVHTLVLANSPVQSISDIKGRSSAAGASAASHELFREIYLEYGIEEADYKSVLMGHQDAVDALKDGNIDVANPMGALPSAAVTDLVASADVRFIHYDKEKLESLQKRLPYFYPIVIPKGTYQNQEEDILTIAVGAVLFTRMDVPEDVIYDITKAIFENNSELVQIHAAGKDWSFDNAKEKIEQGVLDGIPIHPGALKYYREKGVLN